MHLPSAPQWVRNTVLATSLALGGCTTSIENSDLAPEIKKEIAGFREDFRQTCRATDNEELKGTPSLENPKLAHLHNLTDKRDDRIKKGGCRPVSMEWRCFRGTSKEGKGHPSISAERIRCEK